MIGASQLYLQLSPSFKQAVDIAKEKGLSSLLALFPNESHGFLLHKSILITHDA